MHSEKQFYWRPIKIICWHFMIERFLLLIGCDACVQRFMIAMELLLVMNKNYWLHIHFSICLSSHNFAGRRTRLSPWIKSYANSLKTLQPFLAEFEKEIEKKLTLVQMSLEWNVKYKLYHDFLLFPLPFFFFSFPRHQRARNIRINEERNDACLLFNARTC